MKADQRFFSQDLLAALEMAERVAIKYKIGEIGTEHLLYGIISVKCPAADVLRKHGVLAAELDMILADNKGISMVQPDFSARINRILEAAGHRAMTLGAESINTAHVLCELMQDSSCLAVKLLVKVFQVNLHWLYSDAVKATQGAFGESEGKDNSADDIFRMTSDQLFKADTFGYGKKPTSPSGKIPPQLDGMGMDLTEKARQGKIDPIIGRNEEIERVIQILGRKTKNNPVLIGEPGVGKSAVVEGLALKVVGGEVPDTLKNKIIFSLDFGSIMAGTKYRGALEEKLKDAITAVTKSGNIILFIDELHTLASSGSDKGEVNPADMLKPYLARGEMQTIGATTTDEYRKFIEKDKALERRFQPVMVEPPTVEQTIEILKGIRPNFEKFHGVKITDEAIDTAVALSDRYIADRFLPDKAIDLIDEAASRAKANNFMLPQSFAAKEGEIKTLEKECDLAVRQKDFSAAERLSKKIEQLNEEMQKQKIKWTESKNKSDIMIGAEEIADIVSKWTTIPVTRLNATETDRLVNLEQILEKRVIGQPEAVAGVARAIRRARAGLKDPNRPIGSFIFLGPTGVGKTELTKAIAEAMFDNEGLIIRLDMSEYMESHSVSKLIGSPPGYVGYDEGGQLTEAVRRKPYSVVLFDEIEKAHPDVFNMLLQMLDEGRLTDSQGRMVSFKNTVIILTSNAGVSELKKNRALGFAENAKAGEEKNKDTLMNALKARFRPEFLNRIDNIIIFNPLSKDDILKIADIMLKKVVDRVAQKNITLSFDQSFLDFVASNGYDTEYGARPLRRVIEQNLEDNLAERILAGEITEGAKITAYCNDNRVEFKKD